MPINISIHALREEGDVAVNSILAREPLFLSTPSARRATEYVYLSDMTDEISIHALREEGDGSSSAGIWQRRLFLSTPSARRATNTEAVKRLLVEFLSTPSARRATFFHQPGQGLQIDFYPRPPRGGRLVWQLRGCAVLAISIHALREEGDTGCTCNFFTISRFLSTPSARRATLSQGRRGHFCCISIHALREEGDYRELGVPVQPNKFLSTPSARRATTPSSGIFTALIFLSTPSARRATTVCQCQILQEQNFYPRPPRGGRRVVFLFCRHIRLLDFYPRPPRGGRQG